MKNTSADQRADDIAIVGMALKVPGAQNITEFWQNLVTGTESIARLDADSLKAAGERPGVMTDPNYVPAAAPLDGFAEFDAEFFGFSPKDAAILDPQHRKFLEVCWEAMEQSGHAPGKGARNVGVYAGCGMGSYFFFNICSNPDLVDDVGMFLLRHTGNDKDFLSTRVSHVFDLKGPSLNIQTACSTSLVAVHSACEALRKGDCDMALAGGATIELPQGRGYLFKENEILSPDGHCHAFDHRAQGTVFGSGAGAVALRRLSDALADGDHIWAVIKGSAVNNDGAAKAGYLAPSVDGQAEAVARALNVSGVDPATIAHVECHGTGTYLGDPIEVAALTEAYRRQTEQTGYCRIGSVKTNIGHLDTAAGVASLIKTGLSLYHRKFPPSLGYEQPNPAIDFETGPFFVSDHLADWPEGNAPRRAAVNSLGVGGTNAHAILEEAPAAAASDAADWPFQVLCVSGRGQKALEANSAALAAHLRDHPEQPLADIAHTLKTRKHAFADRRVVVAESHDEAAQLLEQGDPRRVFTHRSLGDAPDVVFMFPGGGAQYTGMARDLYETEPVFAEWMDRGLAHLQAQLDYDIRALWLPEADAREAAEAKLKQPSVQLPLIMIVEYALAQLWISWGIRPAALIGHSMGENTAAALAGVMAFEDCIDLVLLRGRLFDSVAPGGMLSIPLPQDEVEALIGDDLDMASVNGPDLCVVSGPDARLEALAQELAAKDIECQRINIDIAAHSRMLDPILPEFRAFLQRLELKAPELPFISNRTGDWITADEATDPDYWVEQLRNTVRFADGIATLSDRPDRVFFEVGPGRALASLAPMSAGVTPNQVLSALRHPEDTIADDRYLLGVIGRFWALGREADWSQVWGEARRNHVVLPTYAFQTSRYFIEPGKAAAQPEAELTRAEDIADWGYRPVWTPRFADCDVETLDNAGADDPKSWLIFADAGGLADRVRDRLAGAGHSVTMLRPGDSFARVAEDEYRLAPDLGLDGYAALFEHLAAEGRLPERILHGWLVTDDERFRPGSDFFTRNMEHGFYSLMYLAQAMEGVERPGKVHLTILTSGAAALRDEALPYPEKALVAGPAGVIPKELPGLSVATIDLPQDKRVAERAGQLLEDLLAAPCDSVAAYRDGRRYEQDWRQSPLPEADTEGLFKPGGTYLITGGLGGIGLTVARDLSENYGAHIVLIARTPLPPRQDWDDLAGSVWLSEDVAGRIAAIRQIEALGGTVSTKAADVCNIEQMKAVVTGTRAEFGRIDGVIHAAGTIGDAPLLGKTSHDVEGVFAPKVHGLRVLDALFADGELDLMLLFSSTSTITRPEGQIDYVAANEYLNAYASGRRGGKTRVVALNWGMWGDVGMAADALAERQGALAETDWRAADAALVTEVADGPEGAHLARLRRSAPDHWITDEHRMTDGTAVMPGTGVVELALDAYRAAGGTLPVELRDLTFLRPLSLPDDAAREVRTSLTLAGKALRFEARSAAEIDGRSGMVLAAEARLVKPERPTLDMLILPALRDRCDRPSAHIGPDGFTSPQAAHLRFGPRWRVVREAWIGAGEGLAHLALPDACRGDLEDGFTLHPALLDLATGWAMELIEGYAPDRLWVPVSYDRIAVYRALPAEITSWVRLRPDSDAGAGLAGFDVTLTDADGAILAEIGNFRMQRLGENVVLGDAPVTRADDVTFDEAAAPRSPAEIQMRRMLALGIRPEEGVAALRRALAAPHAQIALSPLDLATLTDLAARRQAETGEGQSFERPELDADYAAPGNAIEAKLVELWENLLGVNRIGVNDSFFDLGGHSLLAVRLFAAVKREWGEHFPISVLFEAPTIAKCAALIEARTGSAAEVESGAEDGPAPAEPRFRFAVSLNPVAAEANPPLFVVAGMFGNVLNLRHLALQIDDRAVYGLQARGLIGNDAPHERIDEAATDYIAEILALQAEGPYHLAGFSGGGITALEIAQQLTAQGKEVAALIMLDTPLPVRPGLKTVDKALMKLQDFRRQGPGYLLQWARNRWAWERARRADAQGDMPGEQGAFNNRQIELAFRKAVADYELRPWDGPLTLFRPPLDRHWRVSGGNFVSRERDYVFADNAWTGWAPALEVIEVPGDHDSMVLNPNVRVLAQHINAVLRDGGPPRPRVLDLATRTAAE